MLFCFGQSKLQRRRASYQGPLVTYDLNLLGRIVVASSHWSSGFVASESYCARLHANLLVDIKNHITKASDAPTKSRPDVLQDMFGVWGNKYTKDDLTLIYLTISDILDNPDKHRHGCTRRIGARL